MQPQSVLLALRRHYPVFGGGSNRKGRKSRSFGDVATVSKSTGKFSAERTFRVLTGAAILPLEAPFHGKLEHARTIE